MEKFRDLRADEIDCRVAIVKDSGVSILLYKDARFDMNILDEAIGITNWKRHHEVINGNLFCTVEVWDEEKKEWISKQDVGKESYTEKEKGQASDSFKRACFNLGIGRELYTAPFIWIPNKYVNIQQGRNGKPTTNDRFKVEKIVIESKKIVGLSIVNDTTHKRVFIYDGRTEEEKNGDKGNDK